MKKVVFLMMAAAMVLAFAGTGTAAVTADVTGITGESGVSFCAAPVATGTKSGDTVYFVSGGVVMQDMSATGTWTGVSIWQARASDAYVDYPPMVANGYSNSGALVAGAGTGVTTAGIASPVLINSEGKGGVSIFVVTNNQTIDAKGGVTGFTLWGISQDSANAVTVPFRVETGVSEAMVLYPPAYTSNWMQNSTTVSGDSLYFAMSAVTKAYTAGLSNGGGATIYCAKANTANANITTATANNVLDFVYESQVSSFVCGPVIKEGKSGVSIFILGYGVQGALSSSGVSLLGYKGTDFNTNTNAAFNYRIEPVYGLDQGVTAWPTPCLGQGKLNWNNRNYSGNSLFVTDGHGGVSVFNINLAGPTTQAGYEVRYYQYSNDFVPSSVTPIASPVSNGKYLVLPSATGVSIYGSGTGAIASATGTNTNSFIWGTEFTVANGYDTRNWYVAGTPAISHNYAIVAITADTATTNEFRTLGRILLIRLRDGNIMATYNLNGGAIASPIVSGRYVWAIDYNSDIHKIDFGGGDDWVDGNGWWGQFKYDAAKTGHNTDRDDDDDLLPGDSSGCFLSTID